MNTKQLDVPLRMCVESYKMERNQYFQVLSSHQSSHGIMPNSDNYGHNIMHEHKYGSNWMTICECVQNWKSYGMKRNQHFRIINRVIMSCQKCNDTSANVCKIESLESNQYFQVTNQVMKLHAKNVNNTLSHQLSHESILKTQPMLSGHQSSYEATPKGDS